MRLGLAAEQLQSRGIFRGDTFTPRREDFLGHLISTGVRDRLETYKPVPSGVSGLGLDGSSIGLIGLAAGALILAFVIAGYRPRANPWRTIRRRITTSTFVPKKRKNPRRRRNVKLTASQRLRVPSKLPRGHRAKYGTGSLDDDRAYRAGARRRKKSSRRRSRRR